MLLKFYINAIVNNNIYSINYNLGKTDCMSELAMLGNWKNLSISDISLDSRYTINKGFFSRFEYVIQILPYLYHKYHKNGVK